MSLNNKQLSLLGIGSIALFGIGFYNKNFHQSTGSIFSQIEEAYQQADTRSHPFELVLLHDPKMKELTLFYDKKHLGYGERIDKLIHLKMLVPYLHKFSNQKNSKINIYVGDQKINYVLQEIKAPKVLRGEVEYLHKDSLGKVIQLVLKNL